MTRRTSFTLALGGALLCGCAAAITTPQPVEPPPEPSPPPDQLRAPEPDTPSSPAPTMHFGVDGPVVGWITDPEAAQDWSSGEEQDGWITLRPPIHSARTRSGLILRARADAVTAPVPELAPPIRTATGHIFTVDLEDGAPLADFYCDEIEVLAEEGGPEPRTRVRVSDDRGRWIIEGWVQGEVAERGDDDCPPRVVAPRSFYRVSADGVEDPPAPQIPPGYRVARPPDPVPDLDGDLWRPGFEGGQLVCQRWQIRTTDQGLRLERRWIESYGRGRAEMRLSQELIGGPIVYSMYGVNTERRWIRRPDPDVDGMPGLPGQIGAVFPMTLLAVDADRITWIEARSVLAYHPDDVRYWYRTAEACEASLSR